MNQRDEIILERINCIKGILKASETAKTEQSYQKINPDDYARLKENNYTALNSLVRYAKENGTLNYAINIKFNDQGDNQSTMKINNISDEKLMFHLSDLTVSGIPTSQIFFPCVPQNIIVPTSDVLKFDLKWETSTVRTIVKNQKLFIPKSLNLNERNKEIINSYVIEQQLNNGIYNFEIFNKKLNDINYEDIRPAS